MNEQTTFDNPFNVDEEFKVIKSDIQKLVKILDEFKKIKSINSTDSDFLSKLKKYQQRFPSGDFIKNTIAENQNHIVEFIKSAEISRISDFNVYYNQFIESLQQEKVPYRLIEKNIRIGEVEIQINLQNAQIRILFNKLLLKPWVDVWSASDFDKIVNDAINELKGAEIPEEILTTLISDSYQNIRNIQMLNKKPNSELVPIYRLHKEMILGLLQNQMKGRNGLEKRYTDIYFPEWAFRYNLDIYKSILPNLPQEKQLIFMTGSQAETEQNGVVLNGLNPRMDYKKFFYIRKMEK